MSKASGPDRKKKTVALIKLILLVLIIAGIPAFLYLRYGADLFSKDTAERVVDYLQANKHHAALLIILLQIVQVVVCVLPGQPIQFAASYMFGVLPGYLLSIAGAVIGTTISFYLAKLLGSDAMHVIFNEEKLSEYRRRLNSGRGLMIAFLIYLIPGIPKDLVAYAAGISEMRFRPFLPVSVIGRSPAMLGSLFVGHFFVRKDYRAMIILSVVIMLILLVCFIKRKELIGHLDRFEMMDEEKGEKADG